MVKGLGMEVGGSKDPYCRFLYVCGSIISYTSPSLPSPLSPSGFKGLAYAAGCCSAVHKIIGTVLWQSSH